MAFSWLVYSPLSTKAALALEERLRPEIDKLLERVPTLKKKGAWGEITVSADVPAVDDVLDLAEAYDRDLPEEVLERLEACKSSIEIERNGVNDLDPLQVSLLRWLIAEIGPCLIDWGDFQIVTSEGVAGDLEGFESAGVIGDADAAPKPAPKPKAKAPKAEESTVGLERSQELEAAIAQISQDPFLLKRYRKTLEKYPEFIRAYVIILQTDGALSDPAACKRLGVTQDKLSAGIVKLHDMTLDLVEEAEDDDDE